MQKLKTDVHEWVYLISDEGRKGTDERKGHLFLHYMVSGQLGSQLDGPDLHLLHLHKSRQTQSRTPVEV